MYSYVYVIREGEREEETTSNIYYRRVQRVLCEEMALAGTLLRLTGVTEPFFASFCRDSFNAVKIRTVEIWVKSNMAQILARPAP